MRDALDHDVFPEAALAARYRQRRLALLILLLAATVIPIVALGTWWLWPLLVVPAVLAAPLAGGTGLIATLLAAAIALAAASAGDVVTAEVVAGFIAIIIVAALGAAHAGMAGRIIARVTASGDFPATALAPQDVFDLIADRDCRRAAETGSPVSVAVVGTPRVDSVGRDHGEDCLEDLLDAAAAAVGRSTTGSDLVVEPEPGRYVALVAGTSESALDLGERIATALEGVVVRSHDGLRVTMGAVAVGVAQWADGDLGVHAMIDRANAALRQDLVADGRGGQVDDDVTGQFRTAAAVADAA